jgi:hypothetical protein
MIGFVAVGNHHALGRDDSGFREGGFEDADEQAVGFRWLIRGVGSGTGGHPLREETNAIPGKGLLIESKSPFELALVSSFPVFGTKGKSAGQLEQSGTVRGGGESQGFHLVRAPHVRRPAHVIDEVEHGEASGDRRRHLKGLAPGGESGDFAALLFVNPAEVAPYPFIEKGARRGRVRNPGVDLQDLSGGWGNEAERGLFFDFADGDGLRRCFPKSLQGHVHEFVYILWSVIVAESIGCPICTEDIDALGVIALRHLAVQIEVRIMRSQTAQFAAIFDAESLDHGTVDDLHKPLLSDRLVPLEILGVAADRDKFLRETVLEPCVCKGPTASLPIVSGASVGIPDHDPQEDRTLSFLGLFSCDHQICLPADFSPRLLILTREDGLKAFLECLSGEGTECKSECCKNSGAGDGSVNAFHFVKV